MKPVIASIVLMGLGVLAAHAQVPSTHTGSGNSARRPSAARFVADAAMDGMTEIQAAQLALQKSQDRSIKQFAEQMVGDHTKANSELTDLATNKRLRVPTELDASHRAILQALGAKTGSAFDEAFVGAMAASHDAAVRLFTSGKDCDDPDIASFAMKTLPVLQSHQQLLLTIRAGGSP